MATRKKAYKKTTKRPASPGRSRSQQPEKRKSKRVPKKSAPIQQSRKSASKSGQRKRPRAKSAPRANRAARAKRPARKTGRKIAKHRRALRAPVERATRPKLRRNKQGGLREYQGPTFGQTKFGGYKEALKRVGEENQHAYDEAVESLREGFDLGLSESTIKRRRRKVNKLRRKK